MGTIDRNGVYIYSADDTVNTWEAFLNLGQNSVSNAISKLRSNSVYKAADEAGANTLRDSLLRTGVVPSASSPILVYLTKNGKIIAWDGNAWKQDGNTLAASSRVPGEVADLKTPKVGNSILCGVKGPDEKMRMEAGSVVTRVETSQNHFTSGYLHLLNKYSGIATAILTNGDGYVTGDHVLCASAYWLDWKPGSDGLYQAVPYRIFGVSSGHMIRINYIVVGWIK